MAVTATANMQTKANIVSVLRLKDFVNISQSPNKSNIAYAVPYISKQVTLLQYFQWLIAEVQEKGDDMDRTIVYCQTIKQASILYSIFTQELGDNIYAIGKKDMRKRRVEMLHSLSSKEIKKVVLDEMGNEHGSIRVLICTIAFGMGVNCKGVHRFIHFGPSKSIEAYIQESGRAGRDGEPSTALLLYQSLMLLHVGQDMKDYVHGKYKCRRQFIMNTFEECAVQVEEVCCDLCNKDCNLTIAEN